MSNKTRHLTLNQLLKKRMHQHKEGRKGGRGMGEVKGMFGFKKHFCVLNINYKNIILFSFLFSGFCEENNINKKTFSESKQALRFLITLLHQVFNISCRLVSLNVSLCHKTKQKRHEDIMHIGRNASVVKKGSHSLIDKVFMTRNS